jgi:hypothetical protein
MDNSDNVRIKQIEANPGQFKANSNQFSDFSVIFPEKVRSTRNRPADPRKIGIIWNYCFLCYQIPIIGSTLFLRKQY